MQPLPYTVQESDLSTQEMPPVDFSGAIELIKSTDWKAKKTQEKAVCEQMGEACPFNLIFAQGESWFQLMSEDGERFAVCVQILLPKKTGFFSFLSSQKRRMDTFDLNGFSEMERLLRLFYEGQFDQMVK